jgi:hypothetical protein
MRAPVIEWWKPGRVIEEARCTWADWFDALFGKRETFVRIELDGSWCIVERIEAWSFMGPTEPGEAYTITEVHMTRRQFDNLPDFEGF